MTSGESTKGELKAFSDNGGATHSCALCPGASHGGDPTLSVSVIMLSSRMVGSTTSSSVRNTPASSNRAATRSELPRHSGSERKRSKALESGTSTQLRSEFPIFCPMATDESNTATGRDSDPDCRTQDIAATETPMRPTPAHKRHDIRLGSVPNRLRDAFELFQGRFFAIRDVAMPHRRLITGICVWVIHSLTQVRETTAQSARRAGLWSDFG